MHGVGDERNAADQEHNLNGLSIHKQKGNSSGHNTRGRKVQVYDNDNGTDDDEEDDREEKRLPSARKAAKKAGKAKNSRNLSEEDAVSALVQGLLRADEEEKEQEERSEEVNIACQTLLEFASEICKEGAANTSTDTCGDPDFHVPTTRDGKPWCGEDDIILSWNEFQK